MSEFGKQDDAPDLSMELSVEEFNVALLNVADNYSDELAYGLYAGCLDEETGGQAEADVHFKHGLLFKFIAPIQQRRGDYDDSLVSYRQALHEVEAGGFDEIRALELRVAEGHLLMHEFNDPVSAIEPYEEAVRIFEDHYAGPGSEIAPYNVFSGYGHVLSHLAAAYREADDYEKVRELNNRLAALGRVSGAIYGFDSCEHGGDNDGAVHENKPIFKEIEAKLTTEFSLTDDPEGQIEGLRSLETLVDNEDFLPEAPEEREHVLMMIYGRYGMLLPNVMERIAFTNRALSIAKRHGILVPRIDLYVSLAENQAQQGLSLGEQHKSVKKALQAAEAAMDAGASVEAVRLDTVSNLLMMQLEAKRDYIGIEKLRRRLNERGLDVQRTAPGAARPDLN